MLQTATVSPATLAILKMVMQMPAFQQFNLVGGTSLSLQIGHRISIDLDLFTHKDYDGAFIRQELESLGRLEILVDKPPFLQARLDDVKMDFLKFPYPFVQEYIEIERVRLVPIKHIAIMKLLAIARRGVKKGFFDLYFILEQYSLDEVVRMFQLQLPQTDLFHILKSLTYFEDAELNGDPKMLQKTTWKQVKKAITRKVNDYLQSK
ncbi:MAG: nucleotidyl transferase AbiEii/AbiGii toxin family protein [Saprospiraceae bacterium]|nr:nucleotidyl transferase AbiEii/AbiGii toxin family protein [Saprospiraceae bacterium]